jgi:hydroxymethylglutaryl-CoA synthase
MKRYGIDAIGVYVPRLYVDLTGEWARVRAPVLTGGDVAKLVGKVTEGVGVRRMAVADAHQDCATLAAMAAKRAIDAAGIDPRDIDTIAVGTETTVDQSKSTAAYVLGMLERHYGVSMAEAGAPQFQFACIGATYALEAALSRLRAGDATKPYALVIASDISKYPLRTAGEYTQGAGAVALLVSENPRVLELEAGLSATITRDERDFFRPNWSAEAVVDGKYSIDIYLDCLEAAFRGYARRAAAAGLDKGPEGLYGALDHFLFHVPFPRMAEYAAARVLTMLWAEHPAFRERIAKEVPLALAPPGADAAASRREVDRAMARSALFGSAFAAKVAPSLALARDVGNIYSGSMALALASLIESGVGGSLSRRRVVFGSYGSGASAKVMSGVFSERYAELAPGLKVQRDLLPEADGGTRVPLSVSDYERLHGLTDVEWLEPHTWRVRPRGASVRPPQGEFALDHLGTSSSPEKTDRGYRYYVWAP